MWDELAGALVLKCNGVEASWRRGVSQRSRGGELACGRAWAWPNIVRFLAA